jgi:hypothetical protein
MTTTTIEREKLFEAVKALSDDKVKSVLDLVRKFQDEDDEPLTEDEIAQLAEAEKDIAAGRVYTLEEFNRRMATLP